MTITSFLLLLLIAGVCGSIAQSLAGHPRGGCLVSIVLGFIGAVFGSWLSQQLGMRELLSIRIGGETFPVIWSVIGAALFAAVLGIFRGRRR